MRDLELAGCQQLAWLVENQARFISHSLCRSYFFFIFFLSYCFVDRCCCCCGCIVCAHLRILLIESNGVYCALRRRRRRHCHRRAHTIRMQGRIYVRACECVVNRLFIYYLLIEYNMSAIFFYSILFCSFNLSVSISIFLHIELYISYPIWLNCQENANVFIATNLSCIGVWSI